MRRMLAACVVAGGLGDGGEFLLARWSSGVAQGGGVSIHPECAGVEVLEVESGDESGEPVQPAVDDAAGEVAGAGGGDGGVGMGCAEGVDVADAGDESDAAACDVFDSVWTGARCGVGDAGVVWSGLCDGVEELERATEDEQAGDARRDEGCDGKSADQGKVRQIQTRDAQAQGEGGYVAGERGDYEPDALCGGSGVQLRDDVGPDGAGARDAICLRLRFARRLDGLGVPMIENPPLARSLYRDGRAGPVDSFRTVCGGGRNSGLSVPAKG